MDRQEYEIMLSVEDRHWWYVGMQRITTILVAQLYPDRSDLSILDAGCGRGTPDQAGPVGPGRPASDSSSLSSVSSCSSSC
jgi:hypothetical protein